MRKPLFLCLLITSQIIASAQWQWSNPQPTGNINTKVIFTDSLQGFIMNEYGDLYRSPNAGEQWVIQKNFPHTHIMDLKDSTGIIAGGFGTIYISTDNGNNWINRSITASEFFTRVQVISRDTIILIANIQNGGDRKLFISTDRGLSWKLRNDTFIFKSVHFLNSQVAYATSYEGIYKTIDGGVIWENLYSHSSSAHIDYIRFLDETTGFAFRQSYGLMKTTDSGRSWRVINGTNPMSTGTLLFFPGLIYSVGDHKVFKSLDAGESWENVSPPAQGEAYALLSGFFTSRSTGYVVGFRGRIIKTTDGGLTWNDYSPTYIDIQALQFVADSIGYAATWNHTFKTTDGGKKWVQLPLVLSRTSDRFQNLHFFSKDSGIAIAEIPVQVYHTYNGGQTWKKNSHPFPPQYNMYYPPGTSCINNTCYISIDDGFKRIFRSTDAGETWKEVHLNNNIPYRKLHFVTERTGFAAFAMYLYKTEDSAKSWKQIYFEGNTRFNDTWFLNQETGYAVGDNGYIVKTADSGRTWNRIWPDPTNNNFDDIYTIRFFNKKVGFFIAKAGKIFKSTDGGYSWKHHGTTRWESKIIKFTSDTSVYIAGVRGVIIKRPLWEYSIDSLKVNVSGCNAQITGSISAVLSTIDSLWVEYGTSFSSSVHLSGVKVSDTTIKINFDVQKLDPNTSYAARIKIYYRGTYYYSDSVSFKTTSSLATPVITLSGSLLTSSIALGNQWFLNHAPITGATGQTYTPTVSGNYTVQATSGSCVSSMSAPYNYVITAIHDPIYESSLVVFPNPVLSQVFVLNKDHRKLKIVILNSVGVNIKEINSKQKHIQLYLGSFPAGVYTIMIYEVSTNKVKHMQLIKL